MIEDVAPIDAAEAPPGPERVRLHFQPVGADVRVPSGTPVFDAASWNGIAIDSTCGGHGTCKKCKVRIVAGDVPVSAVDPRAFTTDELRDGWRLACRAPAVDDLVVEVPPLQIHVTRVLRRHIEQAIVHVMEPETETESEEAE